MILKDGNNKNNFLVETALLGQGLVSISDEEILSIWPSDIRLAWVENGHIRIGSIEEFIPFRNKTNSWDRLDGPGVRDNIKENTNAYLTASGTMVVAKEYNYPLVITAGMGGIGDIKDEKLCYDLPALAELGLGLIATSPKDMLNIKETLSWLEEKRVRVLGYNRNTCNGYILVQENVELAGKITDDSFADIKLENTLILNPIEESKRLQDRSLLNQAILAGKEAEKLGNSYHPAANACFDKLSGGLSSRMQLKSLIENIKLAKKLVDLTI